MKGDSSDPAPVNTDGTGGPNYVDLDSDNDGLPDLQESGIPNPAGLDANNDGKVDSTVDPDGDGIVSPVDGTPAAFGDSGSPALPERDSDGTPDYIDACTISAGTLTASATNICPAVGEGTVISSHFPTATSLYPQVMRHYMY
ncbi:MAG: hypothetical protein U5M51_05065 [Emticicia sp.]|nr:hypothetical protein [Emticicia sp.]